jgi:hypothetical protein
MTIGRRRAWIIVGLAAMATAVAAYPYVLSGAAHFLIVAENADDATVIVPLGGDSVHAVGLWHANPARQILFVKVYPNRIKRLGILPPDEIEGAKDFRSHGVPATAIENIDCGWRTHREALRCLASWLEQHPNDIAAVLCVGLSSRKLAYDRDCVMSEALASRVRIVGLEDREFDPDAWWRSRDQIKTMFNAWSDLIVTWCFGDLPSEPDTWDPDEYERSLP